MPTDFAWPFAADRADVVFCPDPSAAARTVNVTEIWCQEIVLFDVSVQRSSTGFPFTGTR